MAPEAISDDALHAYVDGELSPERRSAFEARLAEIPELSNRVTDYNAQIDMLHTLYDPILSEPVPASLELKRTPLLGPWVRRIAAAFLIIIVGGVAGWMLRGQLDGARLSAGQNLVRSAIIAHSVFTPEVRHPVEVTAEEEAHLVKWLSKRLKAPLKAPLLLDSGFALVGGRLLSGGNGPVAHFMYESEPGQRLTLYVKRRAEGSHETAFRYVHEDSIGAFYWIDDVLSYAIVAELDKDALLAISRTVYDQLEE